VHVLRDTRITAAKSLLGSKYLGRLDTSSCLNVRPRLNVKLARYIPVASCDLNIAEGEIVAIRVAHVGDFAAGNRDYVLASPRHVICTRVRSVSARSAKVAAPLLIASSHRATRRIHPGLLLHIGDVTLLRAASTLPLLL